MEDSGSATKNPSWAWRAGKKLLRPCRMSQSWLFQLNIPNGPSHHGFQYLVGGIPTPLKNVSSSVGMIIPNTWKKTCSKPPTRWWFGDTTILGNLMILGFQKAISFATLPMRLDEEHWLWTQPGVSKTAPPHNAPLSEGRRVSFGGRMNCHIFRMIQRPAAIFDVKTVGIGGLICLDP